MKRYREAELTHGRVCMLGNFDPLISPFLHLSLSLLSQCRVSALAGVLGFFAGENLQVFFPNKVTEPLAINQFGEVPDPFWEVLVAVIGVLETFRARVGWEEPGPTQFSFFKLRDSYEPGTLGFDPLVRRYLSLVIVHRALVLVLSDGIGVFAGPGSKRRRRVQDAPSSGVEPWSPCHGGPLRLHHPGAQVQGAHREAVPDDPEPAASSSRWELNGCLGKEPLLAPFVGWEIPVKGEPSPHPLPLTCYWIPCFVA